MDAKNYLSGGVSLYPLTALALAACGDVDGDGDMDLLVGANDGNVNFFRWGDGIGTEGSTGWSNQSSTMDGDGNRINPFYEEDSVLYARGQDNSAPAFGDVDGDGDLDLMIAYSRRTSDGFYNTLNIRYWHPNEDGTGGTWETTSDII